MDDIRQCSDTRGAIRCGLVEGHDSAHGAHLDGALYSWVDWASTDGHGTPCAWFEADRDE